jgi:hypothetical protein
LIGYFIPLNLLASPKQLAAQALQNAVSNNVNTADGRIGISQQNKAVFLIEKIQEMKSQIDNSRKVDFWRSVVRFFSPCLSTDTVLTKIIASDDSAHSTIKVFPLVS